MAQKIEAPDKQMVGMEKLSEKLCKSLKATSTSMALKEEQSPEEWIVHAHTP